MATKSMATKSAPKKAPAAKKTSLMTRIGDAVDAAKAKAQKSAPRSPSAPKAQRPRPSARCARPRRGREEGAHGQDSGAAQGACRRSRCEEGPRQGRAHRQDQGARRQGRQRKGAREGRACRQAQVKAAATGASKAAVKVERAMTAKPAAKRAAPAAKKTRRASRPRRRSKKAPAKKAPAKKAAAKYVAAERPPGARSRPPPPRCAAGLLFRRAASASRPGPTPGRAGSCGSSRGQKWPTPTSSSSQSSWTGCSHFSLQAVVRYRDPRILLAAQDELEREHALSAERVVAAEMLDHSKRPESCVIVAELNQRPASVGVKTCEAEAVVVDPKRSSTLQNRVSRNSIRSSRSAPRSAGSVPAHKASGRRESRPGNRPRPAPSGRSRRRTTGRRPAAA